MPSLLEAMERKYGQTMPQRQTEDMPIAIFVPKRPPRLSVPTLLVLNDCDIDCGGDDELLEDKCAGVEELDLAKNNLTKWGEVLGILQHMPQVKFVNLSFNRLSEQIDSLNKLQGANGACWQYLRNLVLNSTRIEWSSVQSLLKLLPVLEELHLSLNDYSYVDLDKKKEREANADICESERVLKSDGNENLPIVDIDGEEESQRLNNEKDHKNDNRMPSNGEVISHSELKKLHFSGNMITTWKEICKLGRAFPNLETLLLNECPLNTLNMREGEEERRNSKVSDEKRSEPHEHFEKLKFLNLNNTGLATWDEVDRLARFPSLQNLRIQGWPLWERCEATEHERHQLLVARLPGVSTLNGGGTLSADEREDAERAFIRYYMEKPEADRPDRYWELVGVHGKLDPLITIDLRPEKRVKVTFSCGPMSEVRTVDVYRTVSDLKSRLERLAGIRAAKMRLFYVDQDLRDLQGPEEMRYPHKQLYSYNIRSGDEIIIESKH